MTLQVHMAFQVNSLNCGEAFPNHQGCCSGAWLDFTCVRLKLTNMSLTGGWEQWKNGWKSTICTLSKSQVSQISRTCIAVYVQLDNICRCISRLPAVRGQRFCFGFNLRPWAIASRWQCRTMGPWVSTLVIGLTKNAMRQPLPFFWWYPNCPLRRRAFIRRLKRINHESFHKKPWQLTPLKSRLQHGCQSNNATSTETGGSSLLSRGCKRKNRWFPAILWGILAWKPQAPCFQATTGASAIDSSASPSSLCSACASGNEQLAEGWWRVSPGSGAIPLLRFWRIQYITLRDIIIYSWEYSNSNSQHLWDWIEYHSCHPLARSRTTRIVTWASWSTLI